MKQSHLFTKTRKEAPKDEVAKNAQLLIRAGYVHKEMAGVYSLLPLGFRVVQNIEQIIREEMNAIGGQELSFSVLQDEAPWRTTERWEGGAYDDIWFKTALQSGTELGLAFTHEEPIARAVAQHVSSHRDLPFAAYHFQAKFRNELRAKSGIMRGREFVMKDLYSFSKNQDELDAFYHEAAEAYERIFTRVGIGNRTYKTFASGGVFSTYSHEYQTVSSAGEDTVYIDKGKGIAVNEEVYTDDVLRELGLHKEELVAEKTIEVGNIFKLGTKFSEPLGLTYKDEDGATHPVVMGSYGIGVGRLMGTIAEVLSDDTGLVWPESVAPFAYHIVDLSSGDDAVKQRADALYEAMTARGIDVLYDDRDVRAGEKFADSDLLGIPQRIVVSAKNTNETLEVVRRGSGEVLTLSQSELLA